jgi:dihydroflavonol-4-reductase
MFGAYDTHPSSGQMILDLVKHPIVPIPLGGNNFVDVEDVVEGMISAATRGRSGETYILGNSNLTYEQIFTCISSIIGKRPTHLRLSRGISNILADRLSEWEKLSGREYSINSTLIRLGNIRHYYDSSKAIRELNYPQHPVENAIERAVIWFKQNGKM